MFGQDWHAPYGLWFLISLVLALWAVFNIVQNKATPPFFKATWTVFVLFIPLIGFVGWLLFGPRAPKR